MNGILQKLTTLIESNKNYIIDGSLNRNLLAADARKYDSELLNLLQRDPEIKGHFFAATNDGLVFKKDVFLQFITNKEFLPDSYTKYKIKIGLGAEDGSLLSESGDVVLNWPYKDAILEGGQYKEEQKRSEVFFNEVLAPDQITRLLDDKVFTGWKRYSKDGEHELDELKDDDNLIIKGNNLVVLHSLKRRYAGKVKLIYIDPPYNTGSDSFGYNDRFNRASWLTFMRNRLSVAHDLLAEDGAIYVNLDFNEVHYAKVLMDDIFGEQNFQREIIWRIGWVSGYKTIDNNYIRNHDTILFYSKSSQLRFNKKYIPNSEFKEVVKLEKVKDKLSELGLSTVQQKELVEFINHDSRPERYPIEDIWNANEYDDLNSIAIVSFAGETVSKLLEDKTKEIKGQKSEKLIKRILESHTEKGDLVLDFHMGSGTTATVAHKMERRYIGIEQMTYIEDIAIERLKKVIDGEQSGISKSVNWQGGGSFVYTNIMNNSNKFRRRVEGAKSDADYLELLKEATSSSFLSYRVDPKKLNEDEFRKLSAAEKRRLLLELIDNNTLYVNYEDINDPIFKVSEKDKEFNKRLYEKD